MVQVVILANSWRSGGRCLAGIDITSGAWIRPIPQASNRAIPERFVDKLNLLDVVEIPLILEKPTPTDKYQIENRFVRTLEWRKTGTFSVNNISRFCEDPRIILHSIYDHANAEYLDTLPSDRWKSLTLVNKYVKFIPDKREPDSWRAEFVDGSNNKQRLKVTDPVATQRLRQNENLNGRCLLAISLGEPWLHPMTQSYRCYKLVAGIIKI